MVQLYIRIMAALRSKSEDGAVATEYGVLVAFIAIAIVVAVTAFGDALSGFFDDLSAEVGGWEP